MILLLLWHMHQPMYKDYATDEYAMPWVYLHATKDYAEMGRLVDRHPGVRVTFNFTPCLLESLNDYAQGRARDPLWESLRREPESFEAEERIRLTRQFFYVNVQRAILPHPRYHALYIKHQHGGRLTDQEFRDLQVLFHLAWLGESDRREDPRVRAWVDKGSGYTRDDLLGLRSKLEETIRSIFSLYAKLARAGRIEISTTPYSHPILPLLIDSDVAAISSPGAMLPEGRMYRPNDARVQAAMALESVRQVFGCDAVGFWPAEGSVSSDALNILAAQGGRWAATDEEILRRSASTGAREVAGPEGADTRPVAHRPYRFITPSGEIALFFRDHGLSDAIGFVYQTWDASRAVDDFLARLARIQASNPAAVVSVILDGENAWEHYPANGFDFLDLMYRRLEATAWIETKTFAEVAAASADFTVLDRIHPGSWIGGNFRIWMGDVEKNRAWLYLNRARRAVEERLPDDQLFAGDSATSLQAPLDLPMLRRSLLAAEGSDWFWWFGEPNSSEQDPVFDELFRRHLKNVYRSLGAVPPSYLDAPIAAALKMPRREMTAFFTPEIDGRETSYFEWLAGGRVNLQSGGAMRQSLSHMTRLMYGADGENFYLRIDFREKATRLLSEFSLRVEAVSARRTFSIEIGQGKGHVLAAADEIFEARIPFEELEVGHGAHLELTLILTRPTESERFPPAGSFVVRIPEADFESLNWMV